MVRPIAFVRSVPGSFADALTGVAHPAGIDVAVAREQLEKYVGCLAAGGYAIQVLDTADHLPDAPFVEDVAVLLFGTLVLTRPGAPSRRGEVAGVGEALADRFEIRSIEPPGTIEGGDVLRIGNRAFVGRSSRSNDDGIQQLAAIAAEQGIETIPVPVQNTLHLKSVVTAIDHETLVAAPGHFDPEVFRGLRTLWVEGESEVNTLQLPDGNVLIPESKPTLQDVVSAHGHQVVTVDVSEFEKADGGLTCLSVRTDDG